MTGEAVGRNAAMRTIGAEADETIRGISRDRDTPPIPVLHTCAPLATPVCAVVIGTPKGVTLTAFKLAKHTGRGLYLISQRGILVSCLSVPDHRKGGRSLIVVLSWSGYKAFLAQAERVST